MSWKKLQTSHLILGGVLLIVMTGCVSNIKQVPQMPSGLTNSITLSHPEELVWKSAVAVLSESETFKILDTNSRLITTELRAVDAQELKLMETWLMGKTYKYGFTINISSRDEGRTQVTANIKLKTQQWALIEKEESVENVERYLQQQFFDRLREQLGDRPKGALSPEVVSGTADQGVVNNEADTLREYHRLMTEGVITEEEYEQKKKSLLGLN